MWSLLSAGSVNPGSSSGLRGHSCDIIGGMNEVIDTILDETLIIPCEWIQLWQQTPLTMWRRWKHFKVGQDCFCCQNTEQWRSGPRLMFSDSNVEFITGCYKESGGQSLSLSLCSESTPCDTSSGFSFSELVLCHSCDSWLLMDSLSLSEWTKLIMNKVKKKRNCCRSNRANQRAYSAAVQLWHTRSNLSPATTWSYSGQQ